MKPLTVAVLEDNKDFLKEMIDNLKRTELVTIVVAEQFSDSFIVQVNEKQPEALLLDIHLKDDSIDGINVAEILKKPVLFLSAARRDYLDRIDNLKMLGTFPVDEFGKIPDTEKLKSILKTFIPRVREYQKTQKVKVKPLGKDEIYISPSEVAMILAFDGNHIVHFSNRKPIIIADKNFDYFRQNGFPEDKFYKFGKSHLINISLSNLVDEKLCINYMNDEGSEKKEDFVINPDKRKEIRNIFLK